MNYVLDIFHNELLVCACVGWLTAQILKTLIHMLVHGSFDITRLVGDGGMPSGHSATVTALAVRSGVIYGLSSYEFAFSAILAIIVMHDAMGVRLETGKQAKVIKEMVSLLEKMEGNNISGEEKLKEFVGHTPFQVVAGMFLGAVIALVLP